MSPSSLFLYVLAAIGAIPSPAAAASLIGYWLSKDGLTDDVRDRDRSTNSRNDQMTHSIDARRIFTMKCRVSDTS